MTQGYYSLTLLSDISFIYFYLGVRCIPKRNWYARGGRQKICRSPRKEMDLSYPTAEKGNQILSKSFLAINLCSVIGRKCSVFINATCIDSG